MPDLPAIGSLVSMVLRSSDSGSDGLKEATNEWDQTKVWVDWPGQLPPIFTVHAAEVLAIAPRFVLRPPEGYPLYEHMSPALEMGRYVVEFCAGSGAMGAAAEFLGGEVLASVDNNLMAVEHLERNSHGQVFHGAVGDPHILHQVHELTFGLGFTIMTGFPCQPYSLQGSQAAEKDRRSSTLSDVAWGAFLLRPQAMILECVAEAAQSAFVKREVQRLCALMGWVPRDIILDLAEVWPMSRKRWWCILAPPTWSQLPLLAWEKCEMVPRIRDVFNGWGSWPSHQEVQLQLSVEELTKYLDPRFGRDKRLIEMHDCCPTTLHSYSVALCACPCGCRSSPFSAESLARKGLRGFCVHSLHTNQPRFLHPLEHAGLLGVPLTMDFSADLREANCLLGLVASPIQGVWIFAQLIQGAAKVISNLAFIHPTKVLESYKQEISRQVKAYVNDENVGSVLFSIDTNEGATLRLMSPTTSTVANLVDAERISLGWGDFARVCEGGLLLPGELRLVEATKAPISLEHRTKRQKSISPVGRIVVAIIHRDQFLVEMVNAGDFMFIALHKLGIFNVAWLIDEDGKIYGSDLRVWGSMRLYTMDLVDFPNLRPLLKPTELRAAGDEAALSIGLSDGLLHKAMDSLAGMGSLSVDHAPLVLQPPMGLLVLVITLSSWIIGLSPTGRSSGRLLTTLTGFFSMANSNRMDFIGHYSMDFERLNPLPCCMGCISSLRS